MNPKEFQWIVTFEHDVDTAIPFEYYLKTSLKDISVLDGPFTENFRLLKLKSDRIKGKDISFFAKIEKGR